MQSSVMSATALAHRGASSVIGRVLALFRTVDEFGDYVSKSVFARLGRLAVFAAVGIIMWEIYSAWGAMAKAVIQIIDILNTTGMTGAGFVIAAGLVKLFFAYVHKFHDRLEGMHLRMQGKKRVVETRIVALDDVA